MASGLICVCFQIIVSCKLYAWLIFDTNAVVKAVLNQAWTDPEGSEIPRFQDSWHMKVVMLSALRTTRLYPPGSIRGSHFC
jgi:hypothetical protein